MIQASGRVTILRDFDYTTEEDGEWKRVNTLEHYEVKCGQYFLCYIV